MIALVALLQFALPPDSANLRRAGESARVPAAVMYAVAWQESRSNLSPLLRGPGREQCDSAGCRRVCREVGRFQINPCIVWKHPACMRDSLKVYDANVRCGAAILRAARDGTSTWADAIRRYNGSGPMSRKYQREVLEYIGWLCVTWGRVSMTTESKSAAGAATLAQRALEIAQRIDDALIAATPPQSAADHDLAALFEGAADTLRALAGAPSVGEPKFTGDMMAYLKAKMAEGRTAGDPTAHRLTPDFLATRLREIAADNDDAATDLELHIRALEAELAELRGSVGEPPSAPSDEAIRRELKRIRKLADWPLDRTVIWLREQRAKYQAAAYGEDQSFEPFGIWLEARTEEWDRGLVRRDEVIRRLTEIIDGLLGVRASRAGADAPESQK